MAVKQKLKKLAKRTAKYYQENPEEAKKMITSDVILASFWERQFAPKNKKLG